MNKTTVTIVAIAAVIAIALAIYHVAFRSDTARAPGLTGQEEPAKLTYAAPEYGLSFSYSPGYYLKERDAGTESRPQLSVVLVEDTPENRDVIEGRATEPREGPPSITIDVYPNPDRLPALDWVRADTNWSLRTSEAAPVGRGELTGVTYTWDGLYLGKSVVVTEGEHAYVFSVTWLTPEDPILVEFDRILESARITSEN